MNPSPDTVETGLVLFSHGSLLCGSGASLETHAEKLRQSGRYAAVEPGYLNYSEPPVEIAISRCVRAGATRIVVLPYFLVAGKFVLEDLPTRLDKAASGFPNTEIIMARPLEDASPMVQAIDELLTSAVSPEEWQERAMARSIAACESRSDCPLYGSSLCRVSLS